MEIVPGVFQLKVPIPDNPLGFTLPYVITGVNGHAIVDTGWFEPESFEDLKRELRDHHINALDIKRIIVTHIHPDHSGLAGPLRELTGAELITHELDSNRSPFALGGGLAIEQRTQIRDWFVSNGVTLEELRSGQASNPRMATAIQQYVVPKSDRLVKGGEILEAGDADLEVIWTPGHSPGHICLYDRANKRLYTGDHVLPVITPNVSLRPLETGNPLAEFMASLRKLEHLDVDWALPAHEHAWQDLQHRILELIEHHEARLQEMIDAIGDDARTPYDIASRIKWNLEPWDKLPFFHRRLALSETLAHLVYLESQGRVAHELRAEIIHYAPARPISASA